MSKRTAVKESQPDLLGAPQPAPKAKPIAKVEPKKSTQIALARSQPRTLLDSLREIVSMKSGDVAVAKEVIALIRSEEDRRAALVFNEAMHRAQTDMPSIRRDSFNKHTKSYWAKLEKISKAVDPVIRRNGFTLSYGMVTSPLAEHYRVVCDVSHTGGCTRRFEADVGMDSKGPKGEGNKSLAQGSGSSVTFARRYLKVMIFDVVIEGDDNDGNGAPRNQVVDVPLVTQKQHDELVEAIEACGAKRADFCKAYGIAKVADLAADNFDRAMAACRQKAAERRRG